MTTTGPNTNPTQCVQIHQQPPLQELILAITLHAKETPVLARRFIVREFNERKAVLKHSSESIQQKLSSHITPLEEILTLEFNERIDRLHRNINLRSAIILSSDSLTVTETFVTDMVAERMMIILQTKETLGSLKPDVYQHISADLWWLLEDSVQYMQENPNLFSCKPDLSQTQPLTFDADKNSLSRKLITILTEVYCELRCPNKYPLVPQDNQAIDKVFKSDFTFDPQEPSDLKTNVLLNLYKSTVLPYLRGTESIAPLYKRSEKYFSNLHDSAVPYLTEAYRKIIGEILKKIIATLNALRTEQQAHRGLIPLPGEQQLADMIFAKAPCVRSELYSMLVSPFPQGESRAPVIDEIKKLAVDTQTSKEDITALALHAKDPLAILTQEKLQQSFYRLNSEMALQQYTTPVSLDNSIKLYLSGSTIFRAACKIFDPQQLRGLIINTPLCAPDELRLKIRNGAKQDLSIALPYYMLKLVAQNYQAAGLIHREDYIKLAEQRIQLKDIWRLFSIAITKFKTLNKLHLNIQETINNHNSPRLIDYLNERILNFQYEALICYIIGNQTLYHECIDACKTLASELNLLISRQQQEPNDGLKNIVYLVGKVYDELKQLQDSMARFETNADWSNRKQCARIFIQLEDYYALLFARDYSNKDTRLSSAQLTEQIGQLNQNLNTLLELNKKNLCLSPEEMIQLADLTEVAIQNSKHTFCLRPHVSHQELLTQQEIFFATLTDILATNQSFIGKISHVVASEITTHLKQEMQRPCSQKAFAGIAVERVEAPTAITRRNNTDYLPTELLSATPKSKATRRKQKKQAAEERRQANATARKTQKAGSQAERKQRERETLKICDDIEEIFATDEPIARLTKISSFIDKKKYKEYMRSDLIAFCNHFREKIYKQTPGLKIDYHALIYNMPAEQATTHQTLNLIIKFVQVSHLMLDLGDEHALALFKQVFNYLVPVMNLIKPLFYLPELQETLKIYQSHVESDPRNQHIQNQCSTLLQMQNILNKHLMAGRVLDRNIEFILTVFYFTLNFIQSSGDVLVPYYNTQSTEHKSLPPNVQEEFASGADDFSNSHALSRALLVHMNTLTGRFSEDLTGQADMMRLQKFDMIYNLIYEINQCMQPHTSVRFEHPSGLKKIEHLKEYLDNIQNQLKQFNWSDNSVDECFELIQNLTLAIQQTFNPLLNGLQDILKSSIACCLKLIQVFKEIGGLEGVRIRAQLQQLVDKLINKNRDLEQQDKKMATQVNEIVTQLQSLTLDTAPTPTTQPAEPQTQDTQTPESAVQKKKKRSRKKKAPTAVAGSVKPNETAIHVNNILRNNRYKKNSITLAGDLQNLAHQTDKILRFRQNQPVVRAQKYFTRQLKDYLIDRRIPVSDSLKQLMQTIQNAGYYCYVHGGYIRDSLLDLPYNDIDIVTNCPKLKETLSDQTQVALNPKIDNHYFAKFDNTRIDFTVLSGLFDVDGLKRYKKTSDISLNCCYADHDGRVFDPCLIGTDFTEDTLKISVPLDQLENDAKKMLRIIRLSTHTQKGIPTEVLELIKAQLLPKLAHLPTGMIKKELLAIFNRGNGVRNFELLNKNGLLFALFGVFNLTPKTVHFIKKQLEQQGENLELTVEMLLAIMNCHNCPSTGKAFTSASACLARIGIVAPNAIQKVADWIIHYQLEYAKALDPTANEFAPTGNGFTPLANAYHSGVSAIAQPQPPHHTQPARHHRPMG